MKLKFIIVYLNYIAIHVFLSTYGTYQAITIVIIITRTFIFNPQIHIKGSILNINLKASCDL
jgi:hypothetical protein